MAAEPMSWVSPPNSGCPQRFTCSKGLVSFDLGKIPTYFSIVTSSLSILGSLLIFLVYFRLKDRRSIAQKIITLLAIADFFTASGYLLAAWNYLTHFDEKDWSKCLNVFQPVCAIQSYITTWSSLCSFFWTCALALHFYLVLSPSKKHLPAKILVYENIIAWFVPIVIVLPLLCMDKLGFTLHSASSWCYVKDADIYQGPKLNNLTIGLMLVAGELWLMLSCIFVLVMYGVTRYRLHKQLEPQVGMVGSLLNNSQSTSIQLMRSEVKQRLLLIPIVFILLRIFGMIHFFYSIATYHLNSGNCIPKSSRDVQLALGILQAIGDGGQGWGNALLYIFLSPTIRKELLFSPFLKCLERMGRTIKTVGEKIESAGRNDNHQDGNRPAGLRQPHPSGQLSRQDDERSVSRIASISKVNSGDFIRAHTGPKERAESAPPLPEDRLASIEESNG